MIQLARFQNNAIYIEHRIKELKEIIISTAVDNIVSKQVEEFSVSVLNDTIVLIDTMKDKSLYLLEFVYQDGTVQKGFVGDIQQYLYSAIKKATDYQKEDDCNEFLTDDCNNPIFEYVMAIEAIEQSSELQYFPENFEYLIGLLNSRKEEVTEEINKIEYQIINNVTTRV